MLMRILKLMGEIFNNYLSFLIFALLSKHHCLKKECQKELRGSIQLAQRLTEVKALLSYRKTRWNDSYRDTPSG